MTEPPPEIPPWSPLAERARTIGGDLDTETDAAASPGPGPAPDDTGGMRVPLAPSAAPGGRLLRWLVVLLVCALVAALVAAVLSDGSAAPVPTTVVREPQPTSSASSPAPIGTRVALGNGWTVTVVSPLSVATADVVATAPDAAPAEGEELVLVDLELSYTDGRVERESPFEGVDLAVVGDDGQAITPSDGPCTPPPPALDLLAALERGGTAEGRVCFTVPAPQTAGLRLVAEPSMTYGSRPSWFALEPQR